MSNNLTLRRLSFIALLLIFSAYTTQAQSGRRQSNPPPSAPVPTPTPEPTPVPKKQSDEPGVGLLLTMYQHDSFANYPLRFADVVLSSCAERLRRSVTVDVNQNDVNRGEAAKKAKDETKSFVVWLQLANSTMGSSSNNSYSDLEIEYYVFAPVTGKVVTSGRTYQGGNRKGPVTVGGVPRTNNSVYTEQLLSYAAEDAADRILDALHLGGGDPSHPFSSFR